MYKFLLTFFILIFLLIFEVKAQNFDEVDNIIQSGIQSKAFPGAQLLIGSKEGIIYSKNYGFYSYEDLRPISNESIYDLASLTKVTATTPAIMKLYDEQKIGLYDRAAYFFPEFAINGKESITILNLLLHNSGLKPFIPFYQITSNRQDAINIIYNETLKAQPNSSTIYSDLNAILLGMIIEQASGSSLDDYTEENIYSQLGMFSTSFGNKVNKQLTVPTELDNYWRFRQLNGEVHDEAASLLGGVSGNAGLFSNAADLYKYMQMLLNYGEYLNSTGIKQQMFKPETVKLFTTRFDNYSYPNTRALGWETKPVPVNGRRAACGELISDNCFGHTGYTGTSIWADKDRGIVVIFLTNRVYPTRNNNQISEVRPELHNKIFEIIDKNR